MKKILLIVIFIFSAFFQLNTFAMVNNTDFNKDLTYIENQVLNKTYKKDDTLTRLERLEIAVYGALQTGEEEKRIMYLKRAVTSVSKGGNGLNNTSKLTNLMGTTIGSYNWSIGNGNTYNHRYNHYGHIPNFSSHRLPPTYYHKYSHRIYPPNHSNYTGNPYENGNFVKNYSFGTGIKILDD